MRVGAIFLTAALIEPYTFEQIVYQEDAALKDKLSDHCPIAITIEIE